jgi:hypothetical protein
MNFIACDGAITVSTAGATLCADGWKSLTELQIIELLNANIVTDLSLIFPPAEILESFGWSFGVVVTFYFVGLKIGVAKNVIRKV